MNWRMYGCLGICLVFGLVQFGCSNSGTKSDVSDKKAGDQSLKAAAPPGMKMPSGGGSGDMYKTGGNVDPQKMMPSYQGDYPGIPAGGAPGGGASPKQGAPPQ